MKKIKPFSFTLKLGTDYKNGNSSGQQIDTLAVALDGQDYNDLVDYNFDWMCEVEDSARNYWLDNNAEHEFMQSLSKEDAKKYADDLDAYNEALEAYKDNIQDSWPDIDTAHPIWEEVEDSLTRAHEELRHNWLYGDYRGNFDGIIPKANKMLDKWDCTIDYDEKKDELHVWVGEDCAEYMEYDGAIEKGTQKEIKEHIQYRIETDAYYMHKKKIEEAQKRREERERVAKYQAEQKEARKEAKRKELRAIAE